MKFLKKTAAALLLLGVMATLFVSCGKGEIIAVYNGQAVYTTEVEDYVNYILISSVTSETTEDEQQEMAYDAVRTFVRYKTMEVDLKAKGYVIDEDELDERTEEMIAYIEESYTGGYEDWRNMYLVSKSFLREDLRRYMIAELFNEYAQKELISISEEEVKNYYLGNGLNYTDPAGYTWTSVYRQVLDDRDEAECAAAETELLDYLRKISNGIMTLADVKAELLSKYSEEDGYTMINFYSGENFTATTDVYKVSDLNAKLGEIAETYGELDPSAESDTDEYKNYMNYVGACAQAEVFYALQTLEVGEVYSKPIKSIGGYYILSLDSVKTTNGFQNFEDVKEEIYETIYEERLDATYDAYITEIEEAYSVSYLFDLT